MTKWVGFAWLAICVFCMANSGFAQELRIYTTIHDLAPAASQKTPSQCSLMLFHAGKVYDYIEPAQEVTVFEPSHRRFTVLNIRRQLRTELTQDEIRQFLGLAMDEAQRRLAGSESERSPVSRRALDLLQFQLHPEFITTFDGAKSQLTLSSPEFQYIAVGDAAPSDEIVEKYLHVADWMAQFNSVLHPQSLLPAPRMKLNEELRQRGLIPRSVKLVVQTDPAIQLEARHEWTWNLQKTDRQLIDDWEKQLQTPKLRSLSFRQFQQEMLKTETVKRH